MTATIQQSAPTKALPANGVHSPEVNPRRHRISAHEYELLAAAGAFEGLRVELIDGEIIEMTPTGESHVGSTNKTHRQLNLKLEEQLVVRGQSPLNAGIHGSPEPDVAVVLFSKTSPDAAPSEAELVIEVSNSTLKYDQTDKASLYASLGVPDYWIVNLVANTLEVRRAPIELATARFGFEYSTLQIIPRTGTVSPLVAPDVTLRVEDLLP